ncbi:hypothetical protein CNMCM8980_000667 [Aspergillus fumigatiaffinis]|jgi:hypothetical protein|uniref:3'-5' exonuclease domain-containing protein n=1 Tax=Aspergillus fumigatiaffinis TaxID=340414 RepID=A0A8H4HCY5_9EURO|nr:hypothetical protein CNMCM5878_000058 [Aspergillus fumigatiaffinis]KAF4233126.1 hypothetical protein CNMCM6805_009466 [Aspergillus fumigatiaffinis]KAF4240641.1 hypothetical protein CNMCM6457_007219 [Aspergillus fumigatiaffinis]KAF4242017.1 hypothetical protein CNMCM8980_000667 [Aspergillus fumigatiaffinis]
MNFCAKYSRRSFSKTLITQSIASPSNHEGSSGHTGQCQSYSNADVSRSIRSGDETRTEAAVCEKFLVAQQSLALTIPPGPKFWSHRLRKAPSGKDIIVHYCKSLKKTEEVAKYFLNDDVIGFDMEWKPQSSRSASIQNNVSLIQIANAERIALFQIALFKPARTPEDFISPSLRKILESPKITKAGVAIKADCTRLKNFLGINVRGIFELSHLYKLVKYCQSDPALINRRPVNLSEQVEEHFGLPLAKDDDVRCSDWTTALNYRQVQYAATDSYACLCLFNTMDTKRRALTPMPPLPAHAELDQPIRLVEELDVETTNNKPVEPQVIKPAVCPETEDDASKITPSARTM